MSGLLKFISNKKRKDTSEIAVNTESIELCESPNQIVPFRNQLNSLEKHAKALKQKLENRSQSLAVARTSLRPDELSFDCEIRQDASFNFWYDSREVRSFRISGVRDLFQTNLQLTGRFAPPCDQLLNSSLEEVNTNLARVTEPSTSFREFCYFINNHSDSLPTNLENFGRFCPLSVELLNRSDNAVTLALTASEKSDKEEKSSVVVRKSRKSHVF